MARNREEILRRVEEFCRKLYEGNSGLNEDSEIVKGTAPKVLKEEEVVFAIKSMKKGRSPFDDGITLDVLKKKLENM